MFNRSSLARHRQRAHIIDRDAQVCEELTVLFRIEGFSATYFADGAHLFGAQEIDPADFIIISIQSGDTTGIGLLTRLKRFHSTVPVFIIVESGDVDAAVLAMKFGAWDVVTKPVNSGHLLEVVSSALQHKTKLRAARSLGQRVEVTGFPALTPRESEVLNLIVNGESNKSAARILGISNRTVEVHRYRVMSKLGADNTADLIRIALTCR